MRGPAEPRALSLVNAGTGGAAALRVVGGRIAAVGTEPQPGDLVIDLHGDRLLPGLINAHDHLQLNNYGRLGYRDRYDNVREWIADVAAQLRSAHDLKACDAVPRAQRLQFGAMKNLLCGVTTVAHHDPLYGHLLSDGYPVRVVAQYGWSHSLGVDGEERVRAAYRRTPPAWPWIIHAAEGLDEEAAGELDRLAALGCVNANTVLVHGVALDRRQRQRLVQARAGLIWCPASNLHLFGATVDPVDLIEHGSVALGSDSRLSGSRDLLGELAVAREVSRLDDATLESLVTTSSARLLRLADRGALQAGAVADLLVIPRQMPLCEATRADVRLVMIDGRMLYADIAYAQAVAPDCRWVRVTVDGRLKALDHELATSWMQSSLHEPGLDISEATWRAA